MRVLLGAGHQNVKSNCDVSLRGSTGAGGEVEINIAVTKRLSELLTAKGIEVKLVDANFNCDKTSLDTDYNLALFCHCDMNYTGDNGSGFCDYPEPSSDESTLESQRMAKVIQDTFFPLVGITVKNRSNANTRWYYMWEHISGPTPCVLIEMGQVQDPHDYPILKDTEKVANALFKAIMKALGIQDCDCDKLEKELDEMRESRNKWRDKYEELDRTTTKELQEKVKHIEELQKTIAEQNMQLTTVSSNYDAYSRDIELLKKEKEIMLQEANLVKEALEEANKEIERLAKKLKNCQQTEKKSLLARIKEILKGGA